MSSVDDRTGRARVRDAALELFAERGEDAVTMRQIADREDYTVPSTIEDPDVLSALAKQLGE